MREGRLSWRTGLLALGYEDADAEIARVQEEMAEATNTAQLDEIMLQIDRGRSRQAQNAPAA
jgi:hypothetical protein